ncbi:hypothetical protein PsYK624_142230 [Phanerochaete sordida]|uniref:Antifreeze protein n=1 Tax=Phanerochaete sordida TaxID=48140 RepID=A0A9P3GN16_9APHY|nr:hypothetical protein PsYK624_142230 [Phanerochaete sordida]
MRLTTVFCVVAATFMAQVIAQTPPDCSGCRSPTGCPGLCTESGGEFFCTDYCGTNESFACGACKTAPASGANCFFDNSGQCDLEIL